MQFIPNARVPIIKFESYQQNISCDVSINNLKGQMKSKFLHWISGIDGRFRDLVLLVYSHWTESCCFVEKVLLFDALTLIDRSRNGPEHMILIVQRLEL